MWFALQRILMQQKYLPSKEELLLQILLQSMLYHQWKPLFQKYKIDQLQ